MTVPDLIDFGRRPSPPALSAERAERVVRRHWGWRVAARRLPSYDDQNFRLEQDGSPIGVLKIANVDTPPALVAAQNAAFDRLAEAGVPAPRLLRSVAGEPVVNVPIAGDGEATGGSVMARVLSWLPGRLLADVEPRPLALWSELGSFLGRLDRALVDLPDAALRRRYSWDPRRGHELDGLRRHVIDPARRDLVSCVMRRHVEQILPRAAELPLGVIHGDANDYNILVTGADPPSICGIIDFGDLIWSWRVVEPAVAAAYAVLGQDDPLATAEALVVGYHGQQPLSALECDLFLPLVAARLMISTLHAAYRRAEDPDDSYLAAHEAPAWEMLERLTGLDIGATGERIRAACADHQPL